MEKRALTLIEIMVVIFIITLISGVVGYNLKGSMDKGRAFKTEQGIEQLTNLLLICISEGAKLDDVKNKPASVIRKNGLARDPDKLVVDGWNKPYKIEIDENEKITVTSENLKKYKASHKH